MELYRKWQVLYSHHIDIGTSYFNIGLVNFKPENYDDALAIFEKSLPILNHSSGEDHNQLGVVYQMMANLYIVNKITSMMRKNRSTISNFTC